MIVRILNEGQCVVPSLYYDDMHNIDNEIVEIIAKNDEKNFNKAYAELIDMVRKNGTPWTRISCMIPTSSYRRQTCR